MAEVPVPVLEVTIAGGVTWTDTFMWIQRPEVYKTISAVTRGWPTVITATAHGIPAGVQMPVWIANARGPKINTTAETPLHAEYVDANTLTLLRLNTGGQSTYVANSATLAYWAPRNITGFTAVTQFRRTLKSAVLVELSSEGVAPGFELTGALGKIQTTLTSAQSRALLEGGTAETSGIAQVELKDADGIEYRVLEYQWTCLPEGTRTT